MFVEEVSGELRQLLNSLESERADIPKNLMSGCLLNVVFEGLLALPSPSPHDPLQIFAPGLKEVRG